MIILGLDPHPTTHTAVALDSRGVVLDSLSVKNDADGLNQLWAWSARFEEHCWAIEGAGNRYVALLLALLFANDQSVYHIHPSLTSQYRARRGKKKNDLVDAENVARVLCWPTRNSRPTSSASSVPVCRNCPARGTSWLSSAKRTR
ncbi:IS110 family transposase [Deinococcus aquatilis]|uniref:IS110 family transposase n=1 Tax=Deinococcus aquatilis TaxID=519440 RepID=UPI00036844B3|nr:transposase [Deinococcus aquatilis]